MNFQSKDPDLATKVMAGEKTVTRLSSGCGAWSSSVSKKPAVDRARFPHDYTGPGTRWGLAKGTPCKIVGRRAGGVRIERADGRRFLVGAAEVKRAA